MKTLLNNLLLHNKTIQTIVMLISMIIASPKLVALTAQECTGDDRILSTNGVCYQKTLQACTGPGSELPGGPAPSSINPGGEVNCADICDSYYSSINCRNIIIDTSTNNCYLKVAVPSCTNKTSINDGTIGGFQYERLAKVVSEASGQQSVVTEEECTGSDTILSTNKVCYKKSYKLCQEQLSNLNGMQSIYLGVTQQECSDICDAHDVCESIIMVSKGSGVYDCSPVVPIKDCSDVKKRDNGYVGYYQYEIIGIVPPPLCGNSYLDDNEDCDLGTALNSESSFGCTPDCKKVDGWTCTSTLEEYEQIKTTVPGLYQYLSDNQIEFTNNDCDRLPSPTNETYCNEYYVKLKRFKQLNSKISVDCTNIDSVKERPESTGGVPPVNYSVNCEG